MAPGSTARPLARPAPPHGSPGGPGGCPRARSEPGRQNLIAVMAQEHQRPIGPRADIMCAHGFRRRPVVPLGRQGRQVRAQYQPHGKGNDVRSSSTSRP